MRVQSRCAESRIIDPGMPDNPLRLMYCNKLSCTSMSQNRSGLQRVCPASVVLRLPEIFAGWIGTLPNLGCSPKPLSNPGKFPPVSGSSTRSIVGGAPKTSLAASAAFCSVSPTKLEAP